MICRLQLSQVFLFLAVAVLIAGKAASQTRGYKTDDAPARVDSLTALSAGTDQFGDIKSLQTELRRSPDDPITLNNLAVAQAAAGQLGEALKTSLRSVEILGSSAVTRVNLAAIYDRLGRTDEARRQVAEAVRLDPKSSRARSFLCELEMVLNRQPEAVVCYRNLRADFPGRFEFQLNLGAALIKAGELTEAFELIEPMYRERPADIRVMNMLGRVYFFRKDFEKSAAVLKQAVELNPDEPRLRYNLGMSYLAAKNRPAALSQYDLIKESSPDLAGKLYRSLFRKYIIDVRK